MLLCVSRELLVYGLRAFLQLKRRDLALCELSVHVFLSLLTIECAFEVDEEDDVQQYHESQDQKASKHQLHRLK